MLTVVVEDEVACDRVLPSGRFAKAIAKTTKNPDVLLARYDSPVEHLIHLQSLGDRRGAEGASGAAA